uniref:Uncharacterized protein n=2 Tax=Human herpesvirus 2 TaxID=10310 RepID=A0A481TL54_HHV2|nr:hypothetical protein [Human alphaherpesvirus 2]
MAGGGGCGRVVPHSRLAVFVCRSISGRAAPGKQAPREEGVLTFVLWLEANTIVLREPSGNENEMVSPLTWSTRDEPNQPRRQASISSNTGSVALRMWAV